MIEKAPSHVIHIKRIWELKRVLEAAVLIRVHVYAACNVWKWCVVEHHS